MRKNDRVVANTDLWPFLTRGKIYVILGVKVLKSGEKLVKISTDSKERKYLLNSFFSYIDDDARQWILGRDL